MDPNYLVRLQEVQKKAISDTDVKIEQIKQFKEDYKALQDRLKTLPDKVTHDVMVPLGKLAFMPGQLVHTNEILVLLGDNWFVERSAKQAMEIAGRRIKELDKNLKDLEAQHKLLEPRLGFTSNLQAEIQGHGDIKEITEEYEEAKEKMWDEQHRKNVRKYRKELQMNLESQKLQQKQEGGQEIDSSLWSRLDELEEQETERGEMDSVPDAKDSVDGGSEKSHSNVASDNSSFSDRKVNWADERKDNKDSIESEDDSDDDYTEDDDDADNEANEDDADTMRKPVQKTITFTHSSAPSILPHPVHEAGDSVILSPADIYRHFTPKSILKKSADSKDNTEVNFSRLESEQAVTGLGNTISSSSDLESMSHSLYQSHSQQISASSSSAHKAFTGFVVEKSSDLPTATASFAPETPLSSVNSEVTPRLKPASTSDKHPKRVSKFKASRQNQNPL